MVATNANRLCIYCGQPTKRGRKGEHVIPEAIGGALTLNDVPNRPVCPKCNNGVLSQLDKELCTRSYLSVIASRELSAPLWQAWDVDHDSNNLLVEARPAWAADGSLTALVCYPQITFERIGPELRGDSEEFRRFGEEEARDVLFKAARHCFSRYRAGKKGALNLERVRSRLIRGYRLAPRIFTPHPIGEVAQNVRTQSFVLRFADDRDRRFALHSLQNLSDGRRSRNWTRKKGSHYPTIDFFFDIGETMRALMKLGLNLIAAHCHNTPVNLESFGSAIRLICDGTRQFPPHVMASSGFIHADDIPDIKAADKSHSFRLVHTDRTWHVYSSFFGGQIGAYVRVPGPNHEEWRWADIVAPLKTKKWIVRTSPILPYSKPIRVTWQNGKDVIPSVLLHYSESSVSVEPKRLPRR